MVNKFVPYFVQFEAYFWRSIFISFKMGNDANHPENIFITANVMVNNFVPYFLQFEACFGSSIIISLKFGSQGSTLRLAR